MKKKSPIHAYKRLLAKDQDWDFSFLIALEKKKLQRMHAYFKTSEITENNKYTARELGICLRLIDIFMEEDAAYKTWLDRSFSKTEMRFQKQDNENSEFILDNKMPMADFPVYVNTRNEARFYRDSPIKRALATNNLDAAFLLTINLRELKALHLYHLIREYNLYGWWD